MWFWPILIGNHSSTLHIDNSSKPADSQRMMIRNMSANINQPGRENLKFVELNLAHILDSNGDVAEQRHFPDTIRVYTTVLIYKNSIFETPKQKQTIVAVIGSSINGSITFAM